MKLSELPGKTVETAASKAGYVLGVCADGDTVTGLMCSDFDEDEFFIPAGHIKRIRETVLFTGRGERGVGEKCVTLGKPVFDCCGGYLGRLTDLTAERFKITSFHVGNKKFSADDVICGDAVIIKSSVRFLKSDVKKNGRIILRRGTPLTAEAAAKAAKAGEYVQTNLKTIQ